MHKSLAFVKTIIENFFLEKDQIYSSLHKLYKVCLNARDAELCVCSMSVYMSLTGLNVLMAFMIIIQDL